MRRVRGQLMLNKLKEQGVEFIKDEIFKHEGLKQKINEITNTVKAEADKLGLEEKANGIINTVKTELEKSGVVEKYEVHLHLSPNKFSSSEEIIATRRRQNTLQEAI